jgi:hypothetical protein
MCCAPLENLRSLWKEAKGQPNKIRRQSLDERAPHFHVYVRYRRRGSTRSRNLVYNLAAAAVRDSLLPSYIFISYIFSLDAHMATLAAVKKAVTLPPTVRILASGVPNVPLVNLHAKAPLDPHGHGAHQGLTSPRSDGIASWAFASSPLAHKTYVTGKRILVQRPSCILTQHATLYSPPYWFRPAAFPLHLCHCS